MNKGNIFQFYDRGKLHYVDRSSMISDVANKKSLIKLLSGFGGVNAAVAWSLKNSVYYKQPEMTNPSSWNLVSSIQIDSQTNLLTRYKEMELNYPKFYKMDLLCKLGFISVESLLEKLKQQSNFRLSTEKTAIILANHSASLKNDMDYQNTIKDKSNYYLSFSK